MPYSHSMDRKDNFAGIPVNKIGTTSAPMRDQLEELKAKIRVGMSKVELGFWGAGKGSQQNPTPGTYGRDERTAMRELAKVNQIELTTHATPVGIGPLSGIDLQRGQYSDEARKFAIDEVKRAVEFAAEVTDGGAIVLHAGEYNRPIIEGGLSSDEQLGVRDLDRPLFMEHEDAKNKAMLAVVDEQTGQVTQQVIPMDMKFREPIKDENGNVQVYTDQDINTSNGSIRDPITKEEFFPGDPKQREYTWKDIVKETREHNELIKKGKQDPTFSREEFTKKYATQELTPSEYFRIKQVKDQIFSANGQEAYYNRFLRDIDNAINQGQVPESQKQRLTQEKNHYLESISQIRSQGAKLKDQLENSTSLEKYALKKTAAGLADLGMYAIEQQKKWESERHEKLKNDLFIAPENVFPEQYGGHPEELTQIIKEGRKALTQKLVAYKQMSEEQAEKEAEKRIKATFDIAHANLWKKYFTGSEEQYWDWYMKQLKKLQDSNVLGHIHVTDNFGYGDEHVAPGQGSLPVAKIIDKLKKSKVDFVVEPGWKGDIAITESFKEFSSPIYGLSRPDTSDPWKVIENSYFGRTAPPYFVVGEYGQQFGERVQRDFSSFAGVPFE